ncbi:bifunctional phosphoglucose/phosphomannose isomerase [Candidatus Neomarinimicrobiota bacterium]
MSIDAEIKRYDKSDMRSAIEGCPQQFNHILAKYAAWEPTGAAGSIRKVLFLGMGGSAIGGDMVRIWVERNSQIPMTVIRSYEIPKWVDDETLVIASSYSGNTEETLSAVSEAAATGAHISVITSGGELANLARESGWEHIEMPGGLQPRAAIGYSVASVAVVLAAFGILSSSILDEISAGAKRMEAEGRLWGDPQQDDNHLYNLAGTLMEQLPVIYGVAGTTEALAIRLRGQLAENSKIMSSHHILPEQNHNEIVGLAERIKHTGDPLVIWLADKEDHPRVGLRRKLAGELTGTYPSRETVMSGNGDSLIQRNLSLLHQLDWLSFYAAILGGNDPSQIEILMQLKEKMQQQ